MAVSPGISEELICSICLDTFNNPLILPCVHTFCKQCLVNVQEGTSFRRRFRAGAGTTSQEEVDNSILTCPHCRVEIKLGPNGIDGLPRNTSLANIILSLEEEKRSRNVLCEVCDDDPPRVASKNCADCSVTYCVTCFRQLHPMRGTFKYHMIKETSRVVPLPRCTSPVFDRSASPAHGRFTPSREVVVTDGAESGDEGTVSADQLERLRRQIKTKRKELTRLQKTVQGLLKTTEEETEERMHDVHSVCNQINERVGEREAAMLTHISQQRHEAVRQCLALSSEVKVQAVSLDLLEDQVNDVMSIIALHTDTDVTNDVSSLQKKLGDIQTKSLISKVKAIPRQPRLAETSVLKHVAGVDFVNEKVLMSPVLTELLQRPVSNGPALVDIKWRPVPNATKYRLSATSTDPRGIEVMSRVDLGSDVTSYLLTLSMSDTDYYISVAAWSETGKHPPVGRNIRTLSFVNAIKPRFNTGNCHKKVAVTSTKDEIMHRKCKLASLHNAYQGSGSPMRLETLEGAMADESLPISPHVYWEAIIHFHVFGKLGNSKLLCDIGICKQGAEDGFTPLCDNFNSYCAYLVKRNSRICMEFWDGTNQENPSRSIPIMDTEQEREKTVKLGFYFDALRHIFAVLSPANNSVLTQFRIKISPAVPLCGLYSADQVFVLIRWSDVHKLPSVLGKLMKRR